MKIAYLILAHNNPQLLKRAIGALSSEDCAFFIHVDQKSNIKDFSQLEGENVFFSRKRVPVYWGEFSLVQPVLFLLQQALGNPANCDYFVLMSGRDYPLRSSRYIHKFLEEHRGLEFISMVKMPAPGKPISRINTLRFQSNKPVRRFVVRGLARVGLAQRDYRKHLRGLEPYSGSQWWTLTRDACQYILEFAVHNQHFVRYFEDVFAPDEAFFHTILGNSMFAPRIRRNLLFDDWSTPGPHPAIINERHVAFFESQDRICVKNAYGSGEALFARKFSENSADLIRRIDEMIARKEEYKRSLNNSLIETS
jgi:hypothetical protein